MRTRLALSTLVVMMLVASAGADRSTTVHVGGMFGGVEDLEADGARMVLTGGPRITLAWEHAMPALPPVRGYNIDVTLVPELTAAALMNSDQGELLGGVGVRGELRIAQRSMGLLRIDARLALYVAARALIIGDRNDTGFEVAFGEYLYLGKRSVRLGGEIGLLGRERTAEAYYQVGVFVSAYLGWTM